MVKKAKELYDVLVKKVKLQWLKVIKHLPDKMYAQVAFYGIVVLWILGVIVALVSWLS